MPGSSDLHWYAFVLVIYIGMRLVCIGMRYLRYSAIRKNFADPDHTNTKTDIVS